ncbi:hypothetical protein LguiA_018422 [Lonicera macranthoides]
MEKSKTFQISQSNEETPSEPSDEEIQELSKTRLPQVRSFDGRKLSFYDGFWVVSSEMEAILSFQSHFKAHDTDLILASSLKSGTTWLKALTFSILNRTTYSLCKSPLLTANPHELIPNLEFYLYGKVKKLNLDNIPCPRLFSTHIPFSALPQTIVNSKCRILYICRNPLDQFISYWHFMLKIQHNEDDMETPPSIDEAFELFCRGIHIYGPFWDHEMGYWKASIESPDKVLFLKYEDLKEDINYCIKKIAEFLGFPFSMEEEKLGLVEQISSMCSLQNLKILQVNKEGRWIPFIPNSLFFRNGKVGDWENFLSASQAKRLEKITKDKLSGSGLTLKYFF